MTPYPKHNKNSSANLIRECFDGLPVTIFDNFATEETEDSV